MASSYFGFGIFDSGFFLTLNLNHFTLTACIKNNSDFNFPSDLNPKLKIRNPKSFLLPDQDSNLDKRYQKPSYYHYTIRQSPLVCFYSPKRNANIRRFFNSQNRI